MNTSNPNHFYHSELSDLSQSLQLMAKLAMESVRNAVLAMESGDVETAKQVIAVDDQIDQLEMKIDAESTRYITLRAPVAGDVRLVIVAMKACHELERIADEATNIAKRIIRMDVASIRDEVIPVVDMGRDVLTLLSSAVEYLNADDSKKAAELPSTDAAIDKKHKESFARITDRITREPQLTLPLVDLIFISKSLERIGDHATNIAEEVVFLADAKDIRHTDKVKRSGKLD
jgi:phosphate transport system protein